MSKVAIIATGGTIASRYQRDQDAVGVGASGEHFRDLAASRLPDAEIEVTDFAGIGSYMMSLQQAFELVRTINMTLRRSDVDGVVVTHGTDTLEETAYMADILLETDKPVVFTGAQRAADDPESDGPRNIIDAIQVAGAAESRGLGSLVVFEQEIHAARDVTKTHTSQVRTFQSAEHGKLGEVDRGKVMIHRKPLIRTALHCTRIEPRVDLVKLYLGADSRFIDCAVSSGARGLVVEAFGRGNVTLDVLQGIERAIAAGIPVLVTSRCPRGRVEPVYGGSGGARLAKAGAEFMGDLNGVKARILLAVLLGDTVLDGTLSDALKLAAA